MIFVCMRVCRVAGVHVHKQVHSYGGLRMMSGVFFNNLLFEKGSLTEPGTSKVFLLPRLQEKKKMNS